MAFMRSRQRDVLAARVDATASRGTVPGRSRHGHHVARLPQIHKIKWLRMEMVTNAKHRMFQQAPYLLFCLQAVNRP